ncbi:hypothetical protein HY605_02600, partial [Candidatus Peregrinibacteria bacterium]|nr:hypothetical protein [Candidatus Peregrinibacteria bacterium]
MKKLKGTSLVEMIIYFAIVGSVLFAIMVFAIQIYNVNTTSGNYNELQTNLNILSDQLISKIQYAESVDDAASSFD